MKDWLEIIGHAVMPYSTWWGMPSVYRVSPEQLRGRRDDTTRGQDR